MGWTGWSSIEMKRLLRISSNRSGRTDVKFTIGDKVRIIAWSVPGVSFTHMSNVHLVCGREGKVIKVRVEHEKEGGDGGYKVELPDGHGWWFRACDLVLADSPCSCSNTIDHLPVGKCLIHDRPDPDPLTEAAAGLQALADALEHPDEV
jgi:hypothetical protein